MANKKISELPYINGGKISGNTLVPLVTYFSASTGDTVHTFVEDFQTYLISGLTGNTVVGDFLPLSGGTVTGATNFTSGLTANTISTTNLQVISGSTSKYVMTSLDDNGNTQWVRSSAYNTLLDPSLTMANTVGGIPSGTTVSDLTGKTIVDLLDDILFPTVLPTYTIPTISLVGASTSTVEVGNTIPLTLSASGTKNDAGVYTQLRILKNGSPLITYNGVSLISAAATNIANQFGYTNPNNPNSGFTTSPSSYSESLLVPSPVGLSTTSSTTYQTDGNYNSGLAKLNNKGSLDVRTFAVRSTNAPQLSSTLFNSTIFTYTGIYPYFYGKSSTLPTISTITDAISGGTATKVLSSASGTLTITFGATFEYIWFAHFTNYTTKTKWYVDELNQGSIGGVSNLFGTSTINPQNSPDSFWSSVNFKAYISNYATNTTGTMQLRNT